MTRRMQGEGPPPAVPADSTLIEFPIVESSRRREGPRPELGWMIFEVNEDYLRQKTMPRLVKDYLQLDHEAGNDASVSWASVSWANSPRPVVFSTRPNEPSVAAGADLTADMFSLDGGGFGARRQRPPGGLGDSVPHLVAHPRWSIAFRHRGGSLDAVVSRTRIRNLLASLLLIALLGGAAWEPRLSFPQTLEPGE